MLAELLGPDLIIVLIVLVVVLFGGAAIPKLARNLGSAKNEFEKGLKESKVEPSTGQVTPPVTPPTPSDPASSTTNGSTGSSTS